MIVKIFFENENSPIVLDHLHASSPDLVYYVNKHRVSTTGMFLSNSFSVILLTTVKHIYNKVLGTSKFTSL